jgi:1-acyl-sn-glycerol-3-phosphate acyltransferase
MSAGRTDVVRRRVASISGVVAAAVVLSLLIVPLLVLLVLVDLARLRPRVPLARLSVFALWWAWLETLGVLAAGWLWMTGRRRNLPAHYRLQRWWADRLMAALARTCGVSIDIAGVDALSPGPVVLLVRHASLADSLLTAWVVAERAGLRQRVVLKRELLADPCLDIVGNRLPNCFLDRQAEDSGPGLAEVRRLAETMDEDSAVVIFPEGTRANPTKRRRALDRIAERDPERAERLGSLVHLLPPRPSGTRALLQGAAAVDAGIVVGWHVGFDGLDSFPRIVSALGRGPVTVRMRFRRVTPPTELDGVRFERWLDDLWLGVDRDVDELTGF